MAIWKRKITVADDTVTTAVHLTLKQSLIPNILVTILFFLWGFAYGLLDVLNSHFQKELNISPSRASGLSAAYFGAYLLCPLTISGWILRKFGFRVTFMTGLAVLAVGCLLFWPSGVKRSFGGFCGTSTLLAVKRKQKTLTDHVIGSMFIVGAGLSTLETAADPFLSICGPPRYSEIRLNLAQAVQGVGSFVAPLLASRVFFAHTVDNAQGLKNVQWVYLGVACFVGLLLILFLVAPMPEITDADMGTMEVEIADDYDPGPFRKQYNLFLGVWSQFCYVGAQVAVANYFINFCEDANKSSSQGSDLLAVAQGLYAFNRFLAAGLMMLPAFKPRYMLGTYLGLCFVFVVAAITTKGSTSIAMLILVLCFESCCFATIFTLALRGLGRHTKRGGSFLVAAISGGMVFPPMTGAVVTSHNAHIAMAIPMMGYILAWIFPIYVNFFNRETVDVRRKTDLNIVPEHMAKEMELERANSKEGKQENTTTEASKEVK